MWREVRGGFLKLLAEEALTSSLKTRLIPNGQGEGFASHSIPLRRSESVRVLASRRFLC